MTAFSIAPLTRRHGSPSSSPALALRLARRHGAYASDPRALGSVRRAHPHGEVHDTLLQGPSASPCGRARSRGVFRPRPDGARAELNNLRKEVESRFAGSARRSTFGSVLEQRGWPVRFGTLENASNGRRLPAKPSSGSAPARQPLKNSCCGSARRR